MFSSNNCTFDCANTKPGESYWASFSEKSFTKGRDYKVYKGVLNGRGPMSDSRCVVKVFRRCKGTHNLCRCEGKKLQKAKDLAKMFNDQVEIENCRIKFAELLWAEMDEVSTLKKLFFSGKRKLSKSDIVLIEEDLRIDEGCSNRKRDLKQFVNCHGICKPSTASVLKAFTHFSYHKSDGQLVLCDLEGVQDEKGFYLKTPIIHSRKMEYGNSDKGGFGILEVFRNHVCNDVCNGMKLPNDMSENIQSCNGAVISSGECSREQSSATDNMCQGKDERMSQDVINNNRSRIENQKSVESRKSFNNMPRRHGSISSQFINSRSGSLEPSAPFMEDPIDGMHNCVPPPYSEVSVATWILQEQRGNDCFAFVSSDHVPLPHYESYIESQVSVDSGIETSTAASRKESSSFDSNEDADIVAMCATYGADKCDDCDSAIGKHCYQKQFSASSSNSACISNPSNLANTNHSTTEESPAYCRMSNKYLQLHSNFKQRTACSFSLTDPRAVPGSQLSLVGPWSGAVRWERCVHNNVFPYSNGNHHVLESPPSYDDSQKENSMRIMHG